MASVDVEVKTTMLDKVVVVEIIIDLHKSRAHKD